MWESLFNLKKVFYALEWLKKNNPFYSKIILPANAEGLLSYLNDTDTQFQPNDQNNSENNDEISCENDADEILPPDQVNCTSAEASQISQISAASMLTEKSENDAFYDEYTVYPLYENRSLYQMLRIENSPLDERSKNLDVLCFPDLYPYGTNGLYEDRETPIQFTEFIKAKFMSRHPQFRCQIQYIFHLLYLYNLRQINSGIYQVLNITREQLNAQEYLKKVAEGSLEGNLTSVFSRLKNTEAYWRIPLSQTRCMINNYGPPAFFLTLSPADYDDDELRVYLISVSDENQSNSKPTAELIAADALSVTRFYHKKIKAMLKFLCSPGGPLGVVEHFFCCKEYRGRGTPHFHLLLWIRNAPVIGESSSEEIATFIQKTITCSVPDKNNFPNLH